jgi:hypothetical protein
MRNVNWLCFDCRAAVRRASKASIVRCPSCGKPCDNMGDEIAIPARAKTRDWEALRRSFNRWKASVARAKRLKESGIANG